MNLNVIVNCEGSISFDIYINIMDGIWTLILNTIYNLYKEGWLKKMPINLKKWAFKMEFY